MALIARLLPFAGWPLFGLMIWLYLGQRDTTTQVIERCNTEKAQAAAEAQTKARGAVEGAYEARLAALEAEKEQSLAAILDAEKGRREALERADSADDELARLNAEALNRDDLPHICLNTLVPDDSVEAIRKPRSEDRG